MMPRTHSKKGWLLTALTIKSEGVRRLEMPWKEEQEDSFFPITP